VGFQALYYPSWNFFGKLLVTFSKKFSPPQINKKALTTLPKEMQ
jgi:hypothetical protein